jgi:subtilisin
MAQQSSEADKDKPGRQKSSEKTESSSATRSGAAQGSRVLERQRRKQYLIAIRRTGGFSPLGVPPVALNMVEQALRSNSDVEVVDTLGPKGFGGVLADGMAGPPHVIVARMDESTAAILHQQAQGQLVVEEDQALTLLDAPLIPPMVTGRITDTTQLIVQVLVLGKDEAPIEGAEVYLYGGFLPAVGVTNSAGQVTLSLLGDSAQAIRGIYVKAKSDYWSFYKSHPVIDVTQPNIVVLRPLSDTYHELPNRQFMGWGQKAMRLDQLPPGPRGQGVKVAIIDSGVTTTHQDLRSITQGFDALGKKKDDANWMVDTMSHGTHCAGVIAGSEENNVGILGFAPAAEVHVCKIFPNGHVSQLIDALEYCISQQIDVVNINVCMDQVSEILQQELQRVTNLGTACVVAAGNSGGPVQFPASCASVLAVAAIGRIGEFPPDSYHAQTVQGPISEGYFSPRFTCFGPEVALCAPGVAVLSSVPPNNFATWDGTSAAAPHVTGVAALVLAHHPDFAGAYRARNLQRVQRLYHLLKASARPLNLGDARRTGFGIPDVPTALTLRLREPSEIILQGAPSIAPFRQQADVLSQLAANPFASAQVEQLRLGGWPLSLPHFNPSAAFPSQGHWGWWSG